MQRYKYRTKDTFVNYMPGLGVLTPTFRRAVVPGQKITSLMGNVRVQTPSTLSVVMNGCVATHYTFFVPNRLVWDGWTDFIAGVDGAAAPPTMVGAPGFYFQSVANRHSLYMRAYKLIYNEFFGDKENNKQGTFATVPHYADITDDTDLTQNWCLSLEQRYKDLKAQDEMKDPEFTQGVSTVINLRDFAQAMASARRDFKTDASGDKYVDVLRSMGVDPDWRIQQAPELLGVESREVAPSYSTSTQALTLGQAATKYVFGMNPQVQNKSFSEHGFIVGVVLLRVKTPANDIGPSDLTLGSDRHSWFTGPASHINVDVSTFGGTGDDMVAPQSWPFHSGQIVANKDQAASMDYLLRTTNADIEGRRFESLALPTDGSLDTSVASIHSDWNVTGLTPVPTKLRFS